MIFSTVVVITSANLIRRAGDAAGIKDEAANMMPHAVAPLYAIYTLLNLIFDVVFLNL